MPKQEYPKWVYGPGGQSRVVEDPDKHQALGEGWHEEPYTADGLPPAPRAVPADAIWHGDITPTVAGMLAPKVEYPKWLYAASDQSVLVQNDVQHETYRDGWFESPGEAAAGKANTPALPTVAAIEMTVPERPSTPPVTVPAGAALNINALNVTEAGLYIDTLIDLEQLAALAATEEAGKNRKTVKDAVNARIGALVSPPTPAVAAP